MIQLKVHNTLVTVVTRCFPSSIRRPLEKTGELNKRATLHFVCSIFRTILTGLSDVANRVLLLGEVG